MKYAEAAPMFLCRDLLAGTSTHSLIACLALGAALVITPVVAQENAPLGPVTINPTKQKIQPKATPSKRNTAAARTRASQTRHVNARPRRNPQLVDNPAPIIPARAADSTSPLSSPLNGDGSTKASGGLQVPAQSFGPFGATNTKDLPFTTTSIPQSIFQDQQAHSSVDVLKNDPSVATFDVNSSAFENYRIRGFVLPNQNIQQDGLPVIFGGTPYIEATERVDTLAGAGSVLYGFATPSGLVNFISKRPLDVPYTSLQAGYLSTSSAQGQADISRRFGDGDQFGVRLNVYQQTGNFPISQTDTAKGVQSLVA